MSTAGSTTPRRFPRGSVLLRRLVMAYLAQLPVVVVVVVACVSPLAVGMATTWRYDLRACPGVSTSIVMATACGGPSGVTPSAPGCVPSQTSCQADPSKNWNVSDLTSSAST